jgi:laminin beta 1
MQCDKLTGQCSCKRGITGYHCDRCDRGTYGQIPECRQCGECFDNWSGILAEIKKEIDNLENQATNIAVSSVASVEGFSERYSQLEGKLNDIKKLLNSNQTDRQVKILHDSLYQIE